MKNLVVVNRLADFQFQSENIQIVEADDYLTGPEYSKPRDFRVFNLCKSYTYCSKGYYVSLLAQARGHRPAPGVSTLLDFQFESIIKIIDEDLQVEIQRAFKTLKSEEFDLSIYFGKNITPKYDALAKKLYDQFRAPMLRAKFEKKRESWRLKSIRPISAMDIPENHHAFLIESMHSFFAKKNHTRHRKRPRFDMAILVNKADKLPPSNEKALHKFARAAEELRIGTDFIEAKDFSKIPTYDALFLRETTSVTGHTYRFARRAEAEGLVVMDDPQSILRCCNKICLYELLRKNQVNMPRTKVFDEDGLEAITQEFSFPFVLKVPDSAFSLGVKKVASTEEFKAVSAQMFEQTDLLLAQEFLKTEFDWRVGVLNRKPLFVCRYHMAPNHWQIYNTQNMEVIDAGNADTLHLYEAPKKLLDMAVAASEMIGDGLYGVDIKQVGNKFYVIEVNDNPNIDAGIEDGALKDNLYLEIMNYFLKKLESR
jgi:glutathione synthase/RimK-type ligase-like ATP-grasp enzyme